MKAPISKNGKQILSDPQTAKKYNKVVRESVRTGSAEPISVGGKSYVIKRVSSSYYSLHSKK